jgi:hypothetical protein
MVVMTLNKHQIEGLPKFKCTILDANQFEKLMIDAGYSISGTAPAQVQREQGIGTPEQEKLMFKNMRLK